MKERGLSLLIVGLIVVGVLVVGGFFLSSEWLDKYLDNEGSENFYYSFSFENGMQGWEPDGTDLDSPPVEWSIENSNKLSTVGESSLRFYLANLNDAGKIWVERKFSVESERTYNVKVSYDFASADYGVNLWRIITGAMSSKPLEGNKPNLIFQGDTGVGAKPENLEWLRKDYEFTVNSGSDGNIFVNVGVWGTWETTRIYFVDNIHIQIEPVARIFGSVQLETFAFDHANLGSPVIENGLKYSIENLETRNFGKIISSEKEENFFNFSLIPSEPRKFIQSTDFEKSYLVIFQEFPSSSSPDYRIENASREEKQLNISITDSNKSGTTDITVETLLIRIDRNGKNPPEEVKIITEENKTVTLKY